MRGDVGRRLERRLAPGSTGRRLGGWRARPPPSRRSRATPGRSSAPSGPRPRRAKTDGVAVADVVDRAGRGELVLGELPDRLEHRVARRAPPRCRRSTSDLRTSESIRSSTPSSSLAPSTSVIAARSKPPANTDACAQQRRVRRRRAARRTTRPRRAASADAAASRGDAVRMRNRSPSRSRMSIGLIEIVRAAASSMPSGSPSRLRQISTTAAAVAGSAKSMRDWRARARSTNNVTAGEALASVEGERQHQPPLLARRRRGPRARWRARARVAYRASSSLDGVCATASTTCSQLSSTMSSATSRQHVGHRLDHRSAGLRRDAHGGRDGVGHRRGVGERGQLDHPHPVGVARRRARRPPRARAASCRRHRPRSGSPAGWPAPGRRSRRGPARDR